MMPFLPGMHKDEVLVDSTELAKTAASRNADRLGPPCVPDWPRRCLGPA